MVKLALLIVAFAALIHSSVQIKCYNCKDYDYHSTVPEGTHLGLCNSDNMSKSPTKDSAELNCKKLVEKVTVENKEMTNVLRFPGPKTIKDLNKEIITEYTCETDLCNGAVSPRMSRMSTVFVLLLLTAVFVLL